MKNWWPATITRSSYLTSTSNSRFEPGGTMIITHSRSTAHTCFAGEDTQQLGRWNYITLRGKRERYTTIISIYRPSKYQETYLRQSAYTAKRRKTLQLDDSPDTLWYSDLKTLIQEKLTLGHQVIVGGDFNDDLNNIHSTTNRFMHSLGMREIMNEDQGYGPATHIRGSTKIDGIFATQGIHPSLIKYTSFEQSPSDHRWMIIDIPEQSLIGIARDDKRPPLMRKCTSKIPSVKSKFQTLVESQVQKYNLHTKIKKLYEMAITKNTFTPADEKEYEIVEDRIQRAITYGDSKCRKARMGCVAFSPEQKRLMGSILILKQLKLRLLLKGKNNRPKSKRIQRLMRKYKYRGTKSFSTLEQINQALQQSVAEYNNFKKGAKEDRWSHLESLAYELDQISGKGIQHHFKILKHNEQTKDYFKAIRRSEGRTNGASVDKITIEDESGLRTVYDKTTIEQEIMKANEAKLMQAWNTPLRSEDISILLGEQGDFQKWENVLKGIINLPHNVDEGLKTWYHYVTHVEHHSITDFKWTTEEYMDSWKKIDENKSTLPGIQVAHIKSLDPDSESANVISMLAQIPLLVGYSPKTWRKGIDSMIPKKVADLRPAKLRLILLLDARFNHNNKLIGKKMMEYGEKYGMLAPEQFGSRKSLSAIEHAVNKRLVMDILRQSQTNAIYIANDAKACYDRIILMVAYITMRNFGIPSLVAKSTISSIMDMQHRVRTCYGDSQTYYGGDKWKIKPHGCGQGNGYGPALWACISSPLLNILRNKGYGTKLQQPISRDLLHLAAFAFVDDTDIIQTEQSYDSVTDNTTDNISKLFEDTQSALNTWSSLLQATGGQLEPSKTFFVPIIHKWQGHTPIMHKGMKPELSIHLRSTDQQNKTIESKDPNDSFFTLGIWQSPSGEEKAQKQFLLTKIQEWNNSTTSNKLTWIQARIANKATIGKTLTYSLPATGFSESECKDLQTSYLQSMLGKTGVVRTAPAILAVAPTWLGGFGLLSFEIEQLISHVGFILQHGHLNSITGSLLRTTFEYYALEAGLPGDPLQLPELLYTTKNTWVGTTIKAIRKFKIKITSDIPGLDTWRTNDTYIMDVLRSQGITEKILRILNKVRLYLRVVTLSDLLSSDGKTYDINVLSGNRSTCHPNPSYYRYSWPKMPTPSKIEKEAWYQYICMAFNISPSHHRRAATSEMKWKQKSVKYTKWLYSPTSTTLYQLCGNSVWITWEPAFTSQARYTTRSGGQPFQVTQRTDSCPPDCRIVSVQPRGVHMFITTPADSTAMDHVIQHEAQPDIALPTNANKGPHLSNFLYNILLHNGNIFTDGSSDKGKATYAVVVQPPAFNCDLQQIDTESFIHFAGQVEGSADDTHSYRAELAGILSAIEFTNNACTQKGLTTGRCTIYCDNKGALLASFGHKRPTPRWSSYDLVRRIRHALLVSPITWHYQHIKGHQDTAKHFSQLSNNAQGNVLADHFATLAHTATAPTLQCKSTSSWTLAINEEAIGGDIHKRLQTAIFKPLMTQRWSKIFGLPATYMTLCDWPTFYRNFELTPASDRHWSTKYNTRLLPVGKNLKRRRHSQTEACPCCGEDEDHNHIISCTHDAMAHTFAELYSDIKTYLNQSTDPAVAHDICCLLQIYRDPNHLSTYAEELGMQIHQQLQLGQGAFFAGLWTKHWLQQQEQYHQRVKIKRHAQRWLISLIQMIQQIPKTLWKVRNQVLHNTRDPLTLQRQHNELNATIDNIFQRKPHQRLMSHCDNLYFSKYTQTQIKHMKLHRKTNWITGANLILTKYERSTTNQSARFTSYFIWDNG